MEFTPEVHQHSAGLILYYDNMNYINLRKYYSETLGQSAISIIHLEIMKTHSAVGADMLENLPLHKEEPLVKVAYEICRWHHERYDGKGYPDGLKGVHLDKDTTSIPR